MRQSIKVAPLVALFVFTGAVTYSQSVPPTLGQVTVNCTLTVTYTANTLQPIVIDTSGQACVPSFGPANLLCDTTCANLLTDTGDANLLQATH